MTSEPENGHLQAGTASSFQFSLLTMLALTTVVAVLCSLLFAAPGLVRVVSAASLIMALPVVLTTVAIYARGYTRTFCIGGLFPAGLAMWSTGSNYAMIVFMWQQASRELINLGPSPAVFVTVTSGVSLVAGLLAVLVRWLVERAQHRTHRRQDS